MSDRPEPIAVTDIPSFKVDHVGRLRRVKWPPQPPKLVIVASSLSVAPFFIPDNINAVNRTTELSPGYLLRGEAVHHVLEEVLGMQGTIALEAERVRVTAYGRLGQLREGELFKVARSQCGCSVSDRLSGGEQNGRQHRPLESGRWRYSRRRGREEACVAMWDCAGTRNGVKTMANHPKSAKPTQVVRRLDAVRQISVK
ncbi:hypothetical protein BKA93DRAFT_879012 [Sparassis latifolia]